MLKIAFVNPPHADWSLANNLTYLLCQSHYQRHGKHEVEWLPAPYKWDKYQSCEEVLEEISDADVIMFSSYVWNYPIVDRIAELASDKIKVLGGPHIGQFRPQYDYICQPTKPGEVFMETLIDKLMGDETEIAWELRSDFKMPFAFDKVDYSVYEDHFDYLKELNDYARQNDLEQFICFETTRGCPYQCVFCEWGGGINTKIMKKETDVVKRDIDAMKKAGYNSAYLTDANFGAFIERDVEIFKYAWKNNFNLTDISTMKSKDLKRRTALIDAWFDVVGSTDFVSDSIVPTVSIQSVSEEAMKVAKRVDLSLEDKLELSRHINKRCVEENLPVPALELILAMPGSTIEDFYREMEIIWNFQAWGSHRHDYMFLPDSTLNSEEYKKEFDIKTVEVYTDIVDEDGIDNINGLYQGRKSHFETILSCYSFGESEMKEMWFMNNAANYMLQNWYPTIQSEINVYEFTRFAYNIIEQLESFEAIRKEIDDIFNPETPPRSIRQLGGRFRLETINEFLEENRLFIINGIFEKCLKTSIQKVS